MVTTPRQAPERANGRIGDAPATNRDVVASNGDAVSHAQTSNGHAPERRRRVVLLGLDAADSGLLTKGMDEGRLPNLARLRDQGAWAHVPPLHGFGSGAVWPSFATGVSPAKHGRYFYRQVGPGSYEARSFTPDQFRADPMWVQASRAGRRVAVFDVPKVGLGDSVNGMIAVDWISHGPVYSEMRTQPPEFGGELTDRFGANPLWKCDMPGGRTIDEMRDFVRVMHQRIEQRERCTRHYLANDEFDLFVTVFAEPHCIGHQTWHVRDESHPLHDAAAGAALGDPVLDVYAAIDGAIGRIAAEVDDDTTLIVFSGTGMGPNYTGNNILDEVLRRLDGRRLTPVARATRFVKRRLKRVLPRDWRRRGQRLKRKVEEHTMTADRAARRAFAVPHNDIAGAIRLNIRGREVNGLIEPDDVDEQVARLTRELLALRNADTGEPVVERVVRVADHHEGEAIDHLPDLFVLWNRASPIDRVTSPAVGTVEYVHRGNRTGDHEPGSMFIATGPGVVPGRLEGVSLYDFAPTISAILGFEMDVTDGRVVEALAAPNRAR